MARSPAALARRSALAAGALLLLLPCAHAHEGGDATRAARLVATTPALPRGVVVQVHRSITDQLVAENATAEVLEVVGDDGRAFLRIGPNGVEGDLGTRDYAQSTSPFGTAEGPTDNTGAPRWTRLSNGKSWGWFDHRLHPPVPADGFAPAALNWRVPLRLGARAVVVRGVTEVVRPTGTYQAELTFNKPSGRFAMVSGVIPLFTLTADGPSIVVIGRGGEPVISAGGGEISVNDASPTWALTLASRGEQPSGLVGADEPPRWRVVNDAVASWLDDRAALPLTPPADAFKPQTTKHFGIPFQLDGDTLELLGEVRWLPLASTRPPDAGRRDVLDSLPVRLGLVAVFGAVVVAVRRRRSAAVV